MAEAAAAGGNEQPRRHQRKMLLLTCFSCGKEQQQLAPHEENEELRRRRSGPSISTAVDEKPLRKIADAFKDLANIVNSNNNSDLDVASFSRACSVVAPLFGYIGFHFKFIQMDYVTKVNDISEASKSFKTLQSMVDQDVQTDSVTKQGSHSRNLLKIKRGLDFLGVLYEQVMLTEGNSMREAITMAYTQIFGSYHGWALRKAVSVRLPYVPTKQQLYRKLNEDESTARVQMQTYISAIPPLLRYIENIFLERGLGIDW